MNKDLRKVIQQVPAFLGKELREEKINMSLDYLDFAKIKDNEAVNHNLLFTKCSIMRIV